jgi:PAS domain S-box-containing protein
MFNFQKYYIIVSTNNLTIEQVSDALLKRLSYTMNMLKNKHISVIFPKYFLYLNNIKFANKKLAIISDKNNNSYTVKLKFKIIENEKFKIIVKFVNDKKVEVLIDYQLFFNKINNAANFGIIIFNDKGYVVHCNDAACKLYGYDKNEFIGIKATSFIDTSVHKYFYRLIEDIKSDEPFTVNSIEVRKDGSTFKSLVNARVVETNFGRFAVALVFDITEQVEIQEDLKSQRDLFKKIFEISPVGFFIYNKNGIILDVNQEIIRQLNIPKEIFIGLDINTLKDKRAFNCLFMPIKENKSGEYIGYYEATNSDKIVYVKSFTFPFYHKREQLAFGISLDLTKEKQLQDELCEKQQFYKNIIETSLAAIFITDLDENITFTNRAFANILGYSEEEVTNTNLSNYCFPEQYKIIKKHINTVKTNRSTIYEADFINRNGDIVQLLMYSSSFLNSNNEITGILTVAIDISYQQLLYKMYNNVLTENKELKEEKWFIVNSIHKRLNFFLPSLLELYKIDKSNLTKKQKDEINLSIQNKLYFFSITYADIQLIQDIYKRKFKVRKQKTTFNNLIISIEKYLNSVVLNIPTNKKYELNFEKEDNDITIETYENVIKLCLERLLNNLIFKNGADKIKFYFKLEKKTICIKTKIFYNDYTDPRPIINFDASQFCYLIITELLKEVKGKLLKNNDEIILFFPYLICENDKKTYSYINGNFPINEYSTYLWKYNHIAYFTDDISLEELLINYLKSTNVNLIKLPLDARIIYSIIRNKIDVILVEDNLYENILIDYVELIKKFNPDVSIILLVKEDVDRKKISNFDDVIKLSDRFKDELFIVLSKYLDYGR